MTDAAKPSSSSTSTVQDPSFMSSVLGSLPGVNPEDPRIKNALQQQKPSSSPKKDEGKSSPKKEQSPERK